MRDCEGEAELPFRVVDDITVWADEHGTRTDVRVWSLLRLAFDWDVLSLIVDGRHADVSVAVSFQGFRDSA
jgi:hypothetical protein